MIDLNTVYLIDPKGISEDTRYQVRQKLDKQNLESLVNSDPSQWPPVKLTLDEDGTNFYIVSGFHRVAAAKEIKVSSIRYILVSGTLEELKLIAYGDNRHGKPLTLQEKKEYCLAYYQANPTMTFNAISQQVGLSNKTVTEVVHKATGGEGKVYKKSKLQEAVAAHKDEIMGTYTDDHTEVDLQALQEEADMLEESDMLSKLVKQFTGFLAKLETVTSAQLAEVVAEVCQNDSARTHLEAVFEAYSEMDSEEAE